MSDTNSVSSLETRAHDALVDLSSITGSVLHNPDALLLELVIEAENLAYRLRTSTVASDFGILRAEAVRLSALIHSAFSARPSLAPPEAPLPETADAAHA